MSLDMMETADAQAANRANSAAGAVLVVEDEVLIRMDVADELSAAGYTVYQACDAAAGLRMLEAHPDIAVLFTDIAMPGEMDGLQLARLARARWPAINILLTSGHIRAGVDALPASSWFFPKPLDSRKLVGLLRNLLGGGVNHAGS